MTRILDIVRQIVGAGPRPRATAGASRPDAGDALESQEGYRRLLDAVPHVVWTTRPDGSADYLNRRGEELLGNPGETIHGWRWLELLHPDDRDSARRVWEEAVRSQSAYRKEYRLRTPDGSHRWYLAQAVPLRGATGEVIRWVGTWTDVDDLKRAEERLERQAVLLANVQDSVIVTDADGVVTYWNQGAQKIFGWRPEEMIGRSLLDRFPEEARPAIAELIRAIAAGQEFAGEFEDWRKDGSRVWIDARVARITDDAGGLVGLMGVAHDVTEKRRLEEQYQRAQRMEAIGQLAGGVAHDFNNLLTVIQGYGDLMVESLEDDRARGWLEEIRAAGARSTALVRQLLTFSRREVVAPKVLDLNAVLAGLETMLRRIIGEDLRVETVLAPDLPSVEADPGQIEQVIMNLAVNARDAMPRGGRITIETANVEIEEGDDRGGVDLAPGSYVRLSVADTGTGMTPEVQARIFEPFFTTKERGQGTGLGLAIVHGIVEQSGGAVAVRSEPGAGTTFDVYLPRSDRPADADEPRHDPTPAPAGSETVLVVEDDEAVRGLTLRALDGAGYRVLEASDGEEALGVAEEHGNGVDLLVTDVVMPGMGGRELAAELTRRNPDLEVLYLSGYTDDAVLRHGVRHAEVAFLQKPFSPRALAHKVREVLDRRRSLANHGDLA